jgi:hypothetical protein
MHATTISSFTNRDGQTPLTYIRERHPFHHSTIALLEQALADADKTSLLVKARRLVAIPRTDTATPPYLQGAGGTRPAFAAGDTDGP